MEDFYLRQTGPEVQGILDQAPRTKEQLDAEVGTRAADDQLLDEKILAEKTRAEGAEGTLDGKIDAEQARAEEAEGTLDGKIDAEQARAEAAEGTLDGRIEAEQARAEEAEGTLDGKIDAVEQKVDDIGDAIQFDQDGDLVTVDGSDFENPEARGKIPTIGAILDGRDDGVYDVTAHNDNAKFASLEALLSDENLNTLIPAAVRKGGMSIMFVQSGDNKYVQYRLMSDSWSTNTDDWTIADEGVYVENPEFVYVKTDAENKILWAIKTDGSIYYGAGCPPQVVEYITAQLEELEGDFTTLLNAKVDKVAGRSLIDAEFAASQEVIANPEYLQVTTDSEDKILEGIKTDGTKLIGGDVQVEGNAKILGKVDVQGAIYTLQENLEWIKVLTDAQDRIIAGVRKNGSVYINKIEGLDAQVQEIVNTLFINKSTLDKFSENEGQLFWDGNQVGRAFDSTSIKTMMNQPAYHITDNDGKEKHTSLPVYNIERRANQFREVSWTALFPIPSIGENPYPAGPHKGLPYSSCMEVDKMIGFDISLKTFMTAINNPYSLEYTESLKDNISAYGFTYHPGRGTIAGWCGVVCNVFVEHCIGMSVPHDTGEWAYLANEGLIAEVYDNSAQGLCIGDMLWEPGHGRLVQNLWRNENGLVTKVEVSENANYNSTFFKTSYNNNAEDAALEDFDEDLANRHGKIYRYTKLYENILYEPSPFVQLPGETQEQYVYNDDICTFAGDYACFREGFKIVLNYNLKNIGSWTSLELYKNDVLFGTYSLDADTSVHSFDLSSLNLTYGKYKARLKDGSNYSDYTYFEILETNVVYDGSIKEKTRITFNSTNGTPLFVRFHRLNGGPKAIYVLTDEDISNGYCVINPIDLIAKQYNNLSVDNATYCKVYFVGEYGRVTNEPILTNLNS